MKNKFVRSTIILACFAFAALFIPSVLIKFEIMDAYTAQIINLGGINAIMALSVNIICGITTQVNNLSCISIHN